MDEFSPVPISTLIRVTHRYDGTLIQPSSDEINSMHWNIRNLTNKLHLVEQRVASYPGILHIIAISETCLTTDNFSTFQLKGYQAIHNVRQHIGGGGISVFIHESLCTQPLTVQTNVFTTDFHHFLVVKIPILNLTVAIPYNRPNGSTSAFLSDLEKLCLDIPNCILLGDLNLDLLDKAKHMKLTNLLETFSFGLLNAINVAAVTRQKSGTILDLVATNMLSYHYKLSIVHHSSSDHAILYISMNKNFKSQSSYRTKTKLDLNQAITKVEDMCAKTDIGCGSELNKAIEDIVKDCTKTIYIKSNHRIRKSHVNRDLILAIRERDRLHHLCNLYPDNNHLLHKYIGKKEYVEATNERLRAKYEAERIAAAAGDDRKTWKLYKEIVFNQHQQKKDQPITIKGISTENTPNACNTINDHFCSAGEHLASEIVSIHGYEVNDIEDLYPQHANNNWSFKETNTVDVVRAINCLPDKKSTGIDNVPINLLKSTSSAIAPLIVFCFNLAIRICFFPEELLKGRLKLIHKSGDFDIENFRGLTLLPALSKIFEYLLSEQLIEYLHSISFFSNNQYGFLKNSSCIGAAHQLVDFIKLNFRKKQGKKKKYVACIFVDLKRAFDTVDPIRLERKLRRSGLSPSASKFMLSYLSNRRTATVVGNETSFFRRILVGVAQGSKMGPLHFLIYINDLFQLEFLGNILMYADDTVLYYAADSAEELEKMMLNDMNLLHKWCVRNILTINVGKTCYMTFGRASLLPDLNIVIDNETIKRVRTFKYLGLVLDENLTFDKHVDHVKKMIHPFIPLMWRKGKYIPTNKRKQLYFAYVQSHLVYMLPIYSQGNKTKMAELQTIQNRCVKAVYRFPRGTSSTYLYSYSLLPLQPLALIERVTHLHKMIWSVTKHSFNIRLNRSVNGRATRRRSKIHIEDEHPTLRQPITEYNRLNSELRQLKCIETFKARLRIKVMTESDEYCSISPYFYIN